MQCYFCAHKSQCQLQLKKITSVSKTIVQLLQSTNKVKKLINWLLKRNIYGKKSNRDERKADFLLLKNFKEISFSKVET